MASEEEYYTGLLADLHDPKDLERRYGDHEIPSTEKDPTVDLRKHVARVYKQEKLSSCTSCVICACYVLMRNKESEEMNLATVAFDYSRLFLYYNSRKERDNTAKNMGAGLRDTLTALHKYGVCNESLWPYDINRFAEEPSPACYDEAKENKIVKYERLKHDIQQFRACLRAGFPFAFGFELYPSFKDKDKHKDGWMPLPSEEEIQAGVYTLHAVLAVGYNVTIKRITVLNSWGDTWGDNGYFYMPYSYINDIDRALNFWKIEKVEKIEEEREAETSAVSGLRFIRLIK